MRSRRVLVEYTKDVETYPRHEADGATTIEKGTRRQVDPVSAKALVKDGTVKLVGDTEDRAEARKVIKAADDGGA